VAGAAVAIGGALIAAGQAGTEAFNAIVKGGQVEFRTRNGKTLDLKGCLEREFRIMSDGRDQVYDGELLVVDLDENILPRQTGNGILTKAQKDTITLIEACQVRATVWDVIPLADFEKGVSKMAYRERFALVGEPINKCIRLVTSHEVASMDEAQELYQKYLAEGQEGVILKDPSGVWEDKRVKHQIKLKAELECDLKVVGIEKGSGKFEGKMGSLVCESGDGLVKTNVGTGFSDELRSLDDSHWMGKVVAIKYNARIIDKKTKQSSLFLPVFVELRIDKDTPDLAAQIT
jgi:ATP-dependent DNA ligase